MTCDWPVDRSCLPNAISDVDKVRQQNAEDVAVHVLWALSGRQFGLCETITRPCPTPCWDRRFTDSYLGGPGWFPTIVDGQWRNTTCGCNFGACSYTGPTLVHLPGPVQSIVEVVIDGVVLDPSAYKLEGAVLYRTGGAQWPDQNLMRPLDEAGTWSVKYLRGLPVPSGVGVLTGTLALEFLNACTNGKCRLPRRVESVTRQGITYQMVNPVDILGSGKTGIPEIDYWLAAVNPNAIMQAPKVR